jgi:hypothetical protein
VIEHKLLPRDGQTSGVSEFKEGSMVRLMSRRRTAKRLALWDGRMGREALEERQRGLTLFVTGWLSVLALIVLFMIGSSNNVEPLAVTAVVATFAVALPIMTWGGVCLSRASRLIINRYGFPKNASKTLSIRTMRDPALFDRWVTREQENLGTTTKAGLPLA